MKNKEIEELLNTFKELINTYSPDTEPFTIDYDYEIKYSALESFLSYIEQLEKENERLQQENQQLKKQKDDVVEYIKKHKHLNWYVESCYTDDLLRMLGEIDDSN